MADLIGAYLNEETPESKPKAKPAAGGPDLIGAYLGEEEPAQPHVPVSTKEFIKGHEGFRKSAYDDPTGYRTVGYGSRVRGADPAQPLSTEEAEALLDKDIERHQTFKEYVKVPLTSGQEAALTSLAFNIGPQHDGLKHIISLLNEGKVEEAANEFPRYNKSKDKRTGVYKELPGLVRRREEERKLFLQPGPTAEPETPSTPFDPNKAPAIGTIVQGHRYRGGDASEGNNWEQVTKEGDTSEPWDKYEETPGFDRIIGTTIMPDSEIEQVAKMRGVDPELLKELAPVFGARSAKEGQSIESAINRTFGFGVPEYIKKKSIDNPNLRKAVEDITRIADDRRSWIQTIAEVAGTGGMTSAGRHLFAKAGTEGAEAAAKLGLKDVAEASGLAALEGGARSEEGFEEWGAGLGAGIGGTAAAVIMLATKGKGKKVAKEVGETVNEWVGDTKIQREIAETAQEYQETQAPKLVRDWDWDARKLEGQQANIAYNKELRKLRREQARVYDATAELPAAEKKAARAKWQSEATERLGPARAAVESHHDSVVRTKEFAMFLENRDQISFPAAKKIVAQKLKEGDAEIQREVRNWMSYKATRKVMRERAVIAPPALNDTWRALRFTISDARYVYNELDEIHPNLDLRLEPLVDRMSNAYDRMTVNIAAANKRYSELMKTTRKAKAKPQDVWESLDTGKPVGTVDAPLLQAWKNEFETLRKGVNAQVGEEIIEPVANYVRRIAVTPERATVKVLTAAKRLGVNIHDPVDDAAFDALTKSAEGQSLLRMVNYLGDRKVKDGVSLVKSLREIKEPRNIREKHISKTGTLFDRAEEGIPEELLEKDVRRAYQNWVNSTMRHIHLRESMGDLRAAAQKLRVVGDERGANYIESHLSYLNGTNKGWWTKRASDEVDRVWKTYAGRKAEEATSSTGKAVWEAAEALPDMLSKTQSTMYQNYLSTVKAPFRNLFQPILLTAPELTSGSPLQLAWATRSVTEGYLAVFKDVRGAIQELKDRGHLSERFVGEGLDHIRKGMLDNVGLRKTGHGIEKAGEVLLFGYQLSDTINRAVTMEAAKRVARDLVTDNGQRSKRARQYLQNTGRGFQREVQEALSKGDSERVTDLVVDQLVSKTQFRYNGTALSQYGRDMGPMFSVFTKWPTSVAGDIINRVQHKGAAIGGIQVLTKYFGPLIMLKTLDAAVLPSTLPEYMHGRLPDDLDASRARSDTLRGGAALLGRGGFTSFGPLTSLKTVVTGDITPPAIQLATDMAGTLIKASDRGDAYELVNLASEAAYQRVPMMGAVRFVTDDMATILSGERTRGRTFFDKVQEGGPTFFKESGLRKQFRKAKRALKGNE